jgi:hypothetical protein
MPISTMIVGENKFGWFIHNGFQDDDAAYLRKDGSIGPTTLDHNQEYAYWPTEEEAYAFLEAQQQ